MGIPNLIIGVAGGTASGKTTVVEAILDRVLLLRRAALDAPPARDHASH